MGKLNQDKFAFPFGTRRRPPYAQTMARKKKRLEYKQYQRSLQSGGYWALQLMSIEDSLPSISDLINSPLSKYIILVANDCEYEETADELIVSYAHPLVFASTFGWRQVGQTWLVRSYLG
jgi:hypothetical protein